MRLLLTYRSLLLLTENTLNLCHERKPFFKVHASFCSGRHGSPSEPLSSLHGRHGTFRLKTKPQAEEEEKKNKIISEGGSHESRLRLKA
jgi:hypothetical protein